MWLCVWETDREMEIKTNWVFSLEVFSFSSWWRCSGQRDSQRSFLPLHLILHSSFAKHKTPQDKTLLYWSQVCFSAGYLLSPGLRKTPGFLGSHPALTGGKILDPWSLLPSPPPRGDGQVSLFTGGWGKVAWLSGSSWTRVIDFQGQFQHGWTPPRGFQGCRQSLGWYYARLSS